MAGCLTVIVFVLVCGCQCSVNMNLSYSALDWFVVCECGICWPYSLIFAFHLNLLCIHTIIYLLGSSAPNSKNGRASRNMSMEDRKNPIHHPPTHRGSAGVSCQLKCIVKPVLNGHSQKDQKLVFKTNYRLMQVQVIAECSNWSIL